MEKKVNTIIINPPDNYCEKYFHGINRLFDSLYYRSDLNFTAFEELPETCNLAADKIYPYATHIRFKKLESVKLGWKPDGDMGLKVEYALTFNCYNDTLYNNLSGQETMNFDKMECFDIRETNKALRLLLEVYAMIAAIIVQFRRHHENATLKRRCLHKLKKFTQ